MDRLKKSLFRGVIILIFGIGILVISCSQQSQPNSRKNSNKINHKIDSTKSDIITLETANVGSTNGQTPGSGNQETASSGPSDWRKLGIKEQLDDLLKFQPALDKITIGANPAADKAFEDLLHNRKSLRSFLPKATNCEFERKLCEDSIKTKCCEYLCLDIPNPCAIAMLTSIYQKYPDSEAAPTALLMIARSLWGGDFASGYMSFKDKSHNLVLPIIKRYYPDTWQSDMADYVIGSGRLKSRHSLEKLAILDKAINAFEAKDVLNNSYYRLYMGGENGIALLYFSKSELYFYNGYQLGRESISRTGRLSSESIKLCKKGMDAFAIGHNKYPDSEDLRYNKKGYPMHVAWADRCFDMINRTGDFKDK